jgi:hypothetical protein
MIKWFAKKYILGKVNDLLEVNQDNVTKVKNTIDTWVGRLQKILDCLKNILSKLHDNKLDSEEIDDSVVEI